MIHPSKPIYVPCYGPHWATHMPILAKIIQISNGPVLELGIGIFSTPLLHAMCDAEKRLLDSYEDNHKWVDGHKMFISNLHKITLISNWDNVPIEKRHWGVVFIDHFEPRRAVDAKRAAQYADYVVLHDSNARYNIQYHFDTVYPLYKYRYIFDHIHPHTTVLSNFKNLENL